MILYFHYQLPPTCTHVDGAKYGVRQKSIRYTDTLYFKRNATFLKMPFFWRRVYASETVVFFKSLPFLLEKGVQTLRYSSSENGG